MIKKMNLLYGVIIVINVEMNVVFFRMNIILGMILHFLLN